MKLQYKLAQSKECEVDSSVLLSYENNELKCCVVNYSKTGNNVPQKQNVLYFSKERVQNWFKDVFLPRGYPSSVSSDYLEYQIWDSLQAYCSNLAGALSLHSTLIGFGVGEDSASPLAAALSWLLKDGAGMISSITFAYYKGCELDNNSKQWRLFADVVNDGANCLKLLAPILPFPFIFTICIASVMSSLVGVAGGATRASLIQHQALCCNMADVSAKDGSQETMVNLAGLITSLLILPILTSSTLVTWLTFFIFVCLHLYTNYKAMRSLQIRTLNRPRLLCVFKDLVTRAHIPDVRTVNLNEPLFFGSAFIEDYLTESYKLDAGVNLFHVSQCFSKKEEFIKMVEAQHVNFEEEKYMIFVDAEPKKFFVVYLKFADVFTYLESFWCAYLCALNLEDEQKEGQICPEYVVRIDKDDISESVTKIKGLARISIENITHKLQKKGWLLEPLRLNFGEWKLSSDSV